MVESSGIADHCRTYALSDLTFKPAAVTHSTICHAGSAASCRSPNYLGK